MKIKVIKIIAMYIIKNFIITLQRNSKFYFIDILAIYKENVQ